MSTSSFSARSRRFLVKHPVVVDVGCSCRRRRRRSSLLSSLLSSFSRSPKPGKLTPASHSSSATTTLNSSSASSWDVDYSSPLVKKRENNKKRAAVNESVAVVKDSREPYVDFRESMVQMIVEEELYSWDELNDLLHRFLSLNSPQNHHLILGAFADIWDVGVFE